MMKLPIFLLRWSIIAFSIISSSTSTDTIHPLKNIRDGNTLVSAGRRFVLGFFSPKGTTKRYLGIWFSVSSAAVVWVANRERPLDNTDGVLGIDITGNLVLTGNGSTVFSTTIQNSSSATVAQLLDSGNLVLREKKDPNPETILWQSFDYPTDTFLPGMKIGRDSSLGRHWTLTSWKDESDPAQGEYSLTMDPRGRAQPFLLKNTTPVYRTGPWNGLYFSGNVVTKSFKNYNFTVEENPNATYYEYSVSSSSILGRLVVEPAGYLRRFKWDFSSASWLKIWAAPEGNSCDNYAFCGPNGVCNSDASGFCNCLGGFLAKNQDDWNNQKWSGGCARKTNLSCGDGDGFLQVKGVKLPDTVNSTVNTDINLHQCKEECAKNCSCVAYASANIKGGESGCIIWVGDLIDTRTYAEYGQEIYIRLPKADLEQILQQLSNGKLKAIIGSTLAAAFICLSLIFWGYMTWRKRNRDLKNTRYISIEITKILL